MSGRLPSLASRSLRTAAPSTIRTAAPRQVAPAYRQQAAQRTYATFEGNPHPKAIRKRSFLPRFLLWTTGGVVVFYGVSTVVALNNQTYQDWFADSVPLAEDILDYLDTHDVVSEARRLDYGGIGSQAVQSVGKTWNRLAEAAGRVAVDGREAASDAVVNAREAEKATKAKLAEAREQARKKVAKVSRQGEDEAKEVVDGAKEEAKGALEGIKKGLANLKQETKAAVETAEKDAKKAANTIIQKKEETAPGKPYERPLPVSHEAPQGYSAPRAGDRKLTADHNEAARLRPDPQAPKLPQLAPALSSLTGSEPMIGQLAGTIDDLAAFLRETPTSSANAKYVLDEAKTELQGLSKRLDEIRKSEQARAEKDLSQQAKKFEAELKRKAQEESKKFSQLDADGKKRLEEERKRASADYESRLHKELETQREIINERLKEEVVAQGVEMQKRWMREIKQRVEEERGGRLARLDQLASELSEIEKVTMTNSAALQEGSEAHRTAAAVRALVKSAMDEWGPDDAEASTTNLKRPFRKELELLRSSTLAQNSDIVKTALDALEKGASPDEGVETLSSLTSWYVQRVKPRLLSVALLPEQAGLLSHLTSAILSPLLFTKAGDVPGDDVPAVLARAEYALLQRKDLDAAAREINSLKGWPKVLAEDWLQESRKRLEVEQGVGIVQSEASYNSLLNA